MSSTARRGRKNRSHCFWKVFTKLGKCKKNNELGATVSNALLHCAQAFAARATRGHARGQEATSDGEAGRRAEEAQSALRNLSPPPSSRTPTPTLPHPTPPHPRVQDGPRDGQIDGDPRGLGIRFHSEFSPSAWLEGEAAELEKTLSTDR